MTLIEDSHEGQTVVVCAPDSSCIDSDIGIGSWSMSTCHMSMYTNANSCGKQTEHRSWQRFCFTGDVWRLSSTGLFQRRMPQVRIMHDKLWLCSDFAYS